MPLIRLLTPIALLSFGAALFAVSGPKSIGHATASPTTCRGCTSTPREFFNLDSATLAPPFGQLSVPGSSTLPVFTVPVGKRLILTDVEASGGYLQLTQVSGQTTLVKRGPVWFGSFPGVQYRSSTGLEFAESAAVTWENVTPADIPQFYFHLTGYLVPK